MAMDYMLAQVLTETIDKENKHFKRIRDEQLAKKAAAEEALGIVKSSVVPKKERSCQLSQLEQSLGHFPNPHPHDNKPRLDADPQKLLRFGVTGEGQGRGAYLRLEAKKRWSGGKVRPCTNNGTRDWLDGRACNENLYILTFCTPSFASVTGLSPDGSQLFDRGPVRAEPCWHPELVQGRAHSKL
mmetsp:Transcript_48238/g.99673  ORF Transcript_48238/g.99673 Transcript_48238/m.99673 type:complete len:185 (+) Transcript_48238:103-657(+)